MSHNTFHVSIHVKDIPTAVEQYKKMLGLEPAKVKADYAKFEIADPPVIFSLTLGGEPGKVSHLGIRYPGTGEVVDRKSPREESRIFAMLEQRKRPVATPKPTSSGYVIPRECPWEFYTLSWRMLRPRRRLIQDYESFWSRERSRDRPSRLLRAHSFGEYSDEAASGARHCKEQLLLRSRWKTYCAWDNGVARRLKILMYPRVHSGFSPPRALFSRRSRRFSNNF